MTFRSKRTKNKKAFFALIIHQKDKYIPRKAKEVSTARNHSKISSKLQSLEFLQYPCVNPSLPPPPSKILSSKPPEKDGGKC